MNKKLLLVLILFFLVIAGQVSAQDDGRVPPREARPNERLQREKVPLDRPSADSDDQMKEATDTERDSDKAVPPMMKRPSEISDMRERMRTMMQGDTDFNAIPEKLREKIIDQKEKFSERLEKIKDEKKKVIAEKIEEQIQKQNQRFVKHFLNSADKLTEILSRIENRAELAKERGADITTVENAIKKAKISIANLVEAANKQQNKIYDIKIQSDSTAKSDFGKSRKEIQSDIQALKDLAQQARVDVRKAAVAIAEIKESQRETKVNEDEDSVTPTPTETTSSTN